MSDLKLYKGINHIDDDLIEEADCNHKPIVRRYYAFAASAAALLIAVGVSGTGLFRNGAPHRKPELPDTGCITEENIPSTTTAGKSTVTSAAKPKSSTVTSAVTTVHGTASSVSSTPDTKASTNHNANTAQTTVVSAKSPASQTATAMTAIQAASTAETVTTAAQEFDYEYEGSLIMKKYAAALAAILAGSSVNAIPAQAQAYEPTSDSYQEEEFEQFKNIVDQYDADLDLNSDGNIDIFDVYAFYRCWYNNGADAPDYIVKKYNALPRTTNFFLEPVYFSRYFLSYYGVKLEYYDPNFYLDNCPDTYDEDIPLDVIKDAVKDIRIGDADSFERTMTYIRSDDGSYRLVNADDANRILSCEDKDERQKLENEYWDNTSASFIHLFIDNLIEADISVSLLNELIEGGYADPDIDSNGVFDFDDVVLAGYYGNASPKTVPETDNDRYWRKIVSFYDDTPNTVAADYPEELKDSPDAPISESEWDKAGRLLMDNKFLFDSIHLIGYEDYWKASIVDAMARLCLKNNMTDPKYFDPVYYEKNHFAHFEYSVNFIKPVSGDILFNDLGEYETFYFRHHGGADIHDEQADLAKKYFGCYDEMYKKYPDLSYTEIMEKEFPAYYKNVKTGVYTEPDLDLDGKIGISDYFILTSVASPLTLRTANAYFTDTNGSFIRRYPETAASPKLSQEAIDNICNNFDFNNNGFSCDLYEQDVMSFYIISELEKQFSDEDAMYEAINNYCEKHMDQELTTYSLEKMREFVKKNDVGFSEYIYRNIVYGKTEDHDEENIPDEPAETIANGDANNDGSVNISDPVLIMQSISNPDKYQLSAEGRFNADIDGDGVTNMDALTIQKYLLGLCEIK